jgi:hypothetical protein
MNTSTLVTALSGVLLASAGMLPAAPPQPPKARNVIFIMTDGLRWQDVFRGADPDLLDKDHGGIEEPEAVKREFWRETPAARRAALMPFLWTVIARQGQVYGNRDRASEAFVTNGMNFSYPGYNEIFTGFPDPRIDSNDKNPNPNVTVLEWLNRKPAFAGRVAAFGAWDAFPAILNADRSGLLVNAGSDPLTVTPVSPTMALLNRLKQETEVLGGEALDALTFRTALEYFKQHQPRVLYLSLGETDEWAHSGRYDLYLKAALRADQYAQELWETAQSMEQYRGTTMLIFAVDHGRGEAPVEWKSHGQKIPDSKYVWMAFLGPDTKALGERSNTAPVTQSQVAATLAAFLGEDYNASVNAAGKPVTDTLGR